MAAPRRVRDSAVAGLFALAQAHVDEPAARGAVTLG
jgi:hypothetical protein